MESPYEFRPAESSAPRVNFPAPTGDRTADNQALLAAVQSLKSYNAVRKWGGDARLNNGAGADQSQPSEDGFFVAQFWAYDATAYLCAPARLYNQIAIAVLRKIAEIPANDPAHAGRVAINPNSTIDVARYLALVNFSLADAAIAAWDAKFYYQFPRPVTYIRAAEALEKAVPPAASGSEGGAGGLVGHGASDTLWFPAGAQITNSDNPLNITPPFPAYVSGHAAFGGALFGILRQYVAPGTEFAFLSDEFNGRNKDAFNYIRCERDGGALVDQRTPAKFCETDAGGLVGFGKFDVQSVPAVE